MKTIFLALIFFPLGLIQAQTVQAVDDIDIAQVKSTKEDSLEVEIKYKVKDLSSDQIHVFLGPSDGSGEYAFCSYDVINKDGKRVLTDGVNEKTLVDGCLIIRKRIPKNAQSKDLHIHVKGFDKSRSSKYKVSKKVKL